MSCNSDETEKVKGQSLDHPNRNNPNRGYFPRFRMGGSPMNRQNLRYPAYATGGMPEEGNEESNAEIGSNQRTMTAQAGSSSEGSESGSGTFLSDEKALQRENAYESGHSNAPQAESAQFNFMQTINSQINETSIAMRIPFQNNTLYCGEMITHEQGSPKIELNSRGLYQVVYTLEVQCPLGTELLRGYEAFLSQEGTTVIGSRISIPHLSELEAYTVMGTAYVYVQKSNSDASVELNISPREEMTGVSPITALSATISATLL